MIAADDAPPAAILATLQAAVLVLSSRPPTFEMCFVTWCRACALGPLLAWILMQCRCDPTGRTNLRPSCIPRLPTRSCVYDKPGLLLTLFVEDQGVIIATRDHHCSSGQDDWMGQSPCTHCSECCNCDSDDEMLRRTGQEGD